MNYPLLNAFWTMFLFFMFIIWFVLLFRVFADIFRSHDMSGWGKAAWTILVICLPFLGVFLYLIARGGKMAEHEVSDAQANEAAFRQYVQEAAGASPADQISRLAALRDSGALSDAEFEAQKAKVLAA
jgi:hypothetical protein